MRKSSLHQFSRFSSLLVVFCCCVMSWLSIFVFLFSSFCSVCLCVFSRLPYPTLPTPFLSSSSPLLHFQINSEISRPNQPPNSKSNLLFHFRLFSKFLPPSLKRCSDVPMF